MQSLDYNYPCYYSYLVRSEGENTKKTGRITDPDEIPDIKRLTSLIIKYFTNPQEDVDPLISTYFGSSYFLLKSLLPRNLASNLSTSEDIKLVILYLAAIRYLKDSNEKTKKLYLIEAINCLKTLNTEIDKRKKNVNINFTNSWSREYYYKLDEILQGNIRVWLEHYSGTFSLYSKLQWKEEGGRYYPENNNEELFNYIDDSIRNLEILKDEDKLKKGKIYFFNSSYGFKSNEEFFKIIKTQLPLKHSSYITSERILCRAFKYLREDYKNYGKNKAFDESKKKYQDIIDKIISYPKLAKIHLIENLSNLNTKDKTIEENKCTEAFLTMIYLFYYFSKEFEKYAENNSIEWDTLDSFYVTYDQYNSVPRAIIVYNRIREFLYHFKFMFGVYKTISGSKSNSEVIKCFFENNNNFFNIAIETFGFDGVDKEIIDSKINPLSVYFSGIMKGLFIMKERVANESEICSQLSNSLIANCNENEEEALHELDKISEEKLDINTNSAIMKAFPIQQGVSTISKMVVLFVKHLHMEKVNFVSQQQFVDLNRKFDEVGEKIDKLLDNNASVTLSEKEKMGTYEHNEEKCSKLYNELEKEILGKFELDSTAIDYKEKDKDKIVMLENIVMNIKMNNNSRQNAFLFLKNKFGRVDIGMYAIKKIGEKIGNKKLQDIMNK